MHRFSNAISNTKRILCVLLAALLLPLGACAPKVPEQELPLVDGNNSMTAAVVYDSSCSDGIWEDTFGYLTQSLVLGVSAVAEDVSDGCELTGCDILYLDASLSGSANAEHVKDAVISLVNDGATAVVANELYDFFDAEFIGAYSFEKLSGFPYGMVAIEAGEDLKYIQGIISDYAFLYQNYPEFGSDLHSRDFGYMAACSTAKPIMGYGAYALYSVNEYGKGNVFFTNSLLPNAFSISGFTMTAHNSEQAAFASTTASCNQLLINAIAEYAFMRRYGYSMSRVFGSYGGAGMAWELHYEEITGFENDSARIFGELCREYSQIPSFTLIRSTYKWFLRQESVTYLLNLTHDGHRYEMDFNESAYSSGTHVAENGAWLGLSSIENGGSYFSDYPEYDYRAAPAPGDFDSDGLVDIISGSEDGKLWFFKGEGYSDRLHVAQRQALCDSAGEPLSVPGYSCPIVRDLNDDGIEDILCGAADGNLYLFYGRGGMVFSSATRVNGVDAETQLMPSMGDIDGDGRDELIVGTGDGRILKADSLRGTLSDISGSVAGLDELGSWLCPTVYDYNGDGVPDLAIGTFHGYIALRLNNGDSFTNGGYISCSEKNYKGNYNLKFGNYCVPRFRDLNGDGTDDLICGSLEYGMAVPIDSGYFPFSDELRGQIEYMQDNHFYCGIHFYTNTGASPAREDFELQAQAESRSFYGLTNELQGANQHTWYTATAATAQTFLSQWRNGILWNSGFISANAASIYPHQNAQNVVSLPFFLEKDGEKTILIQNNSTVLYSGEEFTDISARYGMPVCLYYHCDFAYQSEETARSVIEQAESFRQKHGYSFVGEDQLMLASAAAYNLIATANVSEGQLRITPGAANRDFPLYNESYQNACGIRIRFADSIDTSKISSSASVQKWQDGALYVSLDKPISIDFSGAAAASPILSVNIPAQISLIEGGAILQFRDSGMMQVTVEGSASTDSEGWTAESSGGKTTFTKFGSADTLEIKF
ncbi:MAG: VCBS repeat-containing protein [Clostridiales bacterium]|nr:VCBS repeat-containing protein [Clostridiales bacterium]